MIARDIKKVLVTGGSGFIGSAVCRSLVRRGIEVHNIDALTYAADPTSLKEVENSPLYAFHHANVCDRTTCQRIVCESAPDAILHLAAESHVDRSLAGPEIFIDTNIRGTYVLLELALDFWAKRGKPESFVFHHVSTDEVYGDLPLSGGFFTEETPYNPSSPYSASKAASDHLVMAWHRSFKLPVVLSNCSNNYGPYQNNEKLIPHMVDQALRGNRLPVYGRGENVRDWLFVDDHVEALHLVLTQGTPGSKYNVGGNNECTNLDVVRKICALLDRHAPRADGVSYAEQISFVTDRPGHDLRYAIDATHIRKELGWSPRHEFHQGLEKTILHILTNHNMRQETLGSQTASVTP